MSYTVDSKVATFIHSHSLERRTTMSRNLREDRHGKVPVIVGRLTTNDPTLTSCKFVLPEQTLISSLMVLLRQRANLQKGESLILLTDRQAVLPLTTTLSVAYQHHAAPDGFLYLFYTVEQALG